MFYSSLLENIYHHLLLFSDHWTRCSKQPDFRQKMVVTIEPFGYTSKGQSVDLITISSAESPDQTEKPCVKICTLGAAIVSLRIPGAESSKRPIMSDIVLGYDSADDYERNTPYMGTIVGRVAGRIQKACFRLPGSNSVIQVTKNYQNVHCLHGGK